LLQQGDAGSSLFFIISGQVRLFARRDLDSAELGFAIRGDVIGEGEVLEGRVRRCSAVAQGQVDVVELDRSLLVVGDRLPAPVLALLKRVHEKRMKVLDEMSDFLNRW
jgi:CRP-like cAMP-binding protein